MLTSIRGLTAATFSAGLILSAAPALAAEKASNSVESEDSIAEAPVSDALVEANEAISVASTQDAVVTLAPEVQRASQPVDAKEASSLGEAVGLSVSGSATLITDYRFRGVSQTDMDAAIQGGFTISHSSGIYVGTWASNLSGWGTFGGANMELDIFAGFSLPVGQGKLDVGGTWFMYPGGADTTDFVEFYAKLSGDIGPLSLTGSVFYAPAQEALGNVFANGPDAVAGIATDPGDTEDNLYLAADAALGVPGSPITLTAHVGYSDGNPGLGPNGTSIAPTGSYVDWSLGAQIAVIDGLTFGVSYIDTDISEADAAFLQPIFSEGLDGVGSISDATVVASLTASF